MSTIQHGRVVAVTAIAGTQTGVGPIAQRARAAWKRRTAALPAPAANQRDPAALAEERTSIGCIPASHGMTASRLDDVHAANRPDACDTLDAPEAPEVAEASVASCHSGSSHGGAFADREALAALAMAAPVPPVALPPSVSRGEPSASVAAGGKAPGADTPHRGRARKTSTTVTSPAMRRAASRPVHVPLAIARAVAVKTDAGASANGAMAGVASSAWPPAPAIAAVAAPASLPMPRTAPLSDADTGSRAGVAGRFVDPGDTEATLSAADADRRADPIATLSDVAMFVPPSRPIGEAAQSLAAPRQEEGRDTHDAGAARSARNNPVAGGGTRADGGTAAATIAGTDAGNGDGRTLTYRFDTWQGDSSVTVQSHSDADGRLHRLSPSNADVGRRLAGQLPVGHTQDGRWLLAPAPSQGQPAEYRLEQSRLPEPASRQDAGQDSAQDRRHDRQQHAQQEQPQDRPQDERREPRQSGRQGPQDRDAGPSRRQAPGARHVLQAALQGLRRTSLSSEDDRQPV